MNGNGTGPCWGCVAPKRHEACHDTCEEYKKWVAPIIADRERRLLQHRISQNDSDPVGRAFRRLKNRQKRKGK